MKSLKMFIGRESLKNEKPGKDDEILKWLTIARIYKEF